MVPVLFKPVLNWFGYSRRERRSALILLIIILITLTVRIAVPGRKTKPELTYLPLTEQVHNDTMVSPATWERAVNKTFSHVKQGKNKFLEINSCDSASLVRLPAVGPVLARRIIRYRNLLGGFVSKEQLKEVYGLSDSAYRIISPLVRADSLLVRTININTADYKRLIRFPYLNKKEVTSVLKYRESKGRIESLDVLVKEGIISGEKALKIKGYLEIK